MAEFFDSSFTCSVGFTLEFISNASFTYSTFRIVNKTEGDQNYSSTVDVADKVKSSIKAFG